jgi:hypothetical protein
MAAGSIAKTGLLSARAQILPARSRGFECQNGRFVQIAALGSILLPIPE